MYTCEIIGMVLNMERYSVIKCWKASAAMSEINCTNYLCVC